MNTSDLPQTPSAPPDQPDSAVSESPMVTSTSSPSMLNTTESSSSVEIPSDGGHSYALTELAPPPLPIPLPLPPPLMPTISNLPPPPAIYPCPMCPNVMFVTIADMKNHLDTQHKKYQCDICRKLMSHKRNVERHRRSVHENQRGFGCPMCGYRSAHKQV